MCDHWQDGWCTLNGQVCDEDASDRYVCPFNTDLQDLDELLGLRVRYTYYMNPGGVKEAKKPAANKPAASEPVKVRGRRYNTRNRPAGPFTGIVVAHCTCGYTFGEGLDYSTDIVFLADNKGQIVTMECPRCGRLCTAHPRHIF